MKKKGFTLVELLAVIAILAILVIIALPNIMSLFNEAKKNSFNNELKEIYKTAQNQWITDSMIETKQLYYSRTDGNTALQCVSGTNNKTLQLSGRTQLQYGITVDRSGNVIEYVATDGTYMYQFHGDSNNALKVEEIGTVTATGETTGNAVVRLADYNKVSATITCSGGAYTITGNAS